MDKRKSLQYEIEHLIEEIECHLSTKQSNQVEQRYRRVEETYRNWFRTVLLYNQNPGVIGFIGRGLHLAELLEKLEADRAYRLHHGSHLKIVSTESPGVLAIRSNMRAAKKRDARIAEERKQIIKSEKRHV